VFVLGLELRTSRQILHGWFVCEGMKRYYYAGVIGQRIEREMEKDTIIHSS